MRKAKPAHLIVLLIAVLMLQSCSPRRYEIERIEGSRRLMDSTWDSKADPEMIRLVDFYKNQIDSAMNIPIGWSEKTLTRGRKENPLLDFTKSVMKQYADQHLGGADYAAMNAGGLRSDLRKGRITIGDLYEIYSFDNYLVVLELPTKDPNKTTRVVTIDYLAEGNDGFSEFKKAIKVEETGILLRDVMIEHFGGSESEESYKSYKSYKSDRMYRTCGTYEKTHLTILHLNDTHSRIEPLPKSDRYNPNRGGVVRQAAYIEEVRQENPNVLLFHCGDFVQGTPYFNLFRGEVETNMINAMGFDAVGIGNHEFDYGIEGMQYMFSRLNCPVLASNYDFDSTAIHNLEKKYIIKEKAGIKIGIFALGINPERLTYAKNYRGMRFLDPLETANRTAAFLKEKERCKLVICLSHLGMYPGSGNGISDVELAEQGRNIDIILGGHSHSYLKKPEKRTNPDGKEVIINQTGKDGIYVGRIDVFLKEE